MNKPGNGERDLNKEISGKLAEAARKRNTSDYRKAIEDFLSPIDKEVTEIIEEFGSSVTLEGRSVHLLSHAMGDWFRFPKYFKNGQKNGESSLGKKIFSDNIYARVYGIYFHQIPRDSLISLSNSDSGKDFFKEPALLVIHVSDTFNLEGVDKNRVLTLKRNDLVKIGKKIFEEGMPSGERDPFDRIIEACHVALNSTTNTKYNELIKEIHKLLPSIALDDLDSLLKQYYKKTNAHEEAKPKLYKLKKKLGFLLSFYPLFSTKFSEDSEKKLGCLLSFSPLFSTEFSKDSKDSKDKDFCFYLHPIKDVCNEKRGVFLYCFTFKNGNVLARIWESLSRVLDEAARDLYQHDSRAAITAPESGANVRFEEILRRCCRFSEKHVKDLDINTARKAVLEAFWKKGIPEDDCTPNMDEIKNSAFDERRENGTKKGALKDLKSLTGASKVYEDFIQRLSELCINHAEARKEREFKFPEGKSIFLYSPPGCGKETLVHLIHYLARTALILEKDFDLCNNRSKYLYKNLCNGAIKAHSELNINRCTLKKLIRTTKESIKKEPLKEQKLGFFPVNCAQLGDAQFERILFGCQSEDSAEKLSGGVRHAAFFTGTAFLDELNTLPIGMENKLLRLLASPHEGLMYKKSDDASPTQPLSGLNVLCVFASNMTPSELKEERDFNPAVLSRIQQNYFSIPPLRERPEDIALALSNMFWVKSRKMKEIEWEKIDLKAFRFLCTLPWHDNFRSLSGFVDALATQRFIRGMEREKEISFEEVIECAVRNELISGR